MTVLRAAYVKVKPDTDGFDSDLKSRLRRIDASKEGDRTGRTFGKGMSKGFAGSSGTFARVAATLAAKAALVGTGAAAATPGLIQLTAAILPATGALVALPAALGAAGVASATLKVATAGVGKAITTGLTGTAEQAKKSLEGLPPAAKSFAATIVGLKPKIDALRQSVAQRFFLPLQDDIKPLANLYFPLLQKQMADLAGPLGGLGEQIAQSARKAGTFKAVQSIFKNTRLAVIDVRGAIDPLTTALAHLIRSTASFLPGLAQGFADIAARVGAFVTQAARSGQIATVFRNAVTTLKDLGGIAANVGSILHSVFTAATAGGNSLLANFRALTGQVAAFLKSGAGSTGLTSTFQALAALGQALRTSLGAVLPAIGQSLQKLAPAIVALAGPLAQMIVALAPLIPLAAGLAAQLLTRLTPAIAAFAGWLTQNQGALKNFAIAIAIVVVAIKAFGVYTFVAAQATLAWTVAQKAAAVAAKVWAAGQWLLNAALTANPIGIVVVAIAALVAGVILAYKHSATFRTIVQGAWQGIQAAVSFAWNNVIKPAVAGLVAFFRNVIAPTVMYLWNNVFKPAFAGIGWAVHAAWVVIQIALAAFRLLLVNVIFPVIRFLYNNVVKPIFSGIATTISTVWNKGIKPIFQALGSFISKNVAPAFRTGVGAIAAAWNKVKEAAAAPVRFIVDTVINNGIIRGINWLAEKVGVKDRIPPLRWSSSGGGSKPGDKISGNIRGDGYGVGDGKGTGDGIGSLLMGPAKWLGNRIGLGRLVSKFGNNPFVHTLMGAGNRLKGMALDKIQSLIGELGGGGSVGAGGLRSGILGVLGALRSMFGQVGLISGFRPGARTLSGNQSYHALGRAIDIAPVHQWAAYLNATFGSRLRELITPWNDLNIHNGQPHRYTGAIWNQHNFAGGNAHIHAAMANGGIIREPVFGVGSSGRTYSFGERGPETVTPGVGGNTYHIDVAVPVGAHPAEVGRQVVMQIQAFEQANGRRWRD